MYRLLWIVSYSPMVVVCYIPIEVVYHYRTVLALFPWLTATNHSNILISAYSSVWGTDDLITRWDMTDGPTYLHSYHIISDQIRSHRIVHAYTIMTRWGCARTLITYLFVVSLTPMSCYCISTEKRESSAVAERAYDQALFTALE